MRKLIDLLVSLAVAGALLAVQLAPSRSQAPVVPSGGDTDQIGTISASGSANGLIVPLNGYSCLGVDVSGTWSGSLLVQASFDYAAVGPASAHWGTTTVVPVTSGASTQAITANGQFQANAASAAAFRIYAVSLVSGSASIAARRGNGVCTVMADNPLPVTPTSVYPLGATPIEVSATGAAAGTTATLAGAAAKFTYLCGYSVSPGSATAAITISVTTTGLTNNFTEFVGAPVTAAGTTGLAFTRTFSPCVQASAAATGIAVVAGALGTGGTNQAVNAWGFQQ